MLLKGNVNKWTALTKMYLLTCAPSEDSDQTSRISDCAFAKIQIRLREYQTAHSEERKGSGIDEKKTTNSALASSQTKMYKGCPWSKQMVAGLTLRNFSRKVHHPTTHPKVVIRQHERTVWSGLWSPVCEKKCCFLSSCLSTIHWVSSIMCTLKMHDWDVHRSCFGNKIFKAVLFIITELLIIHSICKRCLSAKRNCCRWRSKVFTSMFSEISLNFKS